MSFEKYSRIARFEPDKLMRAGQSVRMTFDAERSEGHMIRLFLKGETARFYLWKSEPDCRGQYIDIADSLSCDKAVRDRYCLDLSSDDYVLHEKTALYRLKMSDPLSYLDFDGYDGDEYTFSIAVAASGLEFEPGGYVRARLEVRGRTTSTDRSGFASAFDREYILPVEPGSYELKTLSLPVKLVDAYDLLFVVEAVGYRGEVRLEQPSLTSASGFNRIPAFAPCAPSHEKWAWVGVNLSKKEWPVFDISLNGKRVFAGELFERIHRFNEFELDLPGETLRDGQNELVVTYMPNYPDPLPFLLRETGYFLREQAAVSIYAVPKIASISGGAAVLVYCREGCTLRLETDSDAILSNAQRMNAGLDVFHIDCVRPGRDVKFRLVCDGGSAEGIITAVVQREDDGVLTGSGDFIYVRHDWPGDLEWYLCWYLANRCGNLLTVRPAYRWSGSREAQAELWQPFVELMNKAGLKYSHMMDGRDLPGAYCNPTQDMLAGDGFLGRQNHEEDGRFAYWGVSDASRDPIEQAVSELWGIKFRSRFECAAPACYHSDRYDTQQGFYMNHLPDTTRDMREAARQFIQNAARRVRDSSRHTGPSAMFDYMIKAGYDWVGAETMYGPIETILADLRGTCRSHGKQSFGTHNAVQWSTTPHDTPARYRRYMLALYASYLHGASEINTEEGFLRLEEYYADFGRLDEPCRQHLKVQQDFYDFVSLNARTGRYYTSFAFLRGHCDGWKSFGSGSIFGQRSFADSDAERAWEVLHRFYPLNNINGALYLHPCPEDREVGFYSGTPNGNCDILPIDSCSGVLDDYRTVCLPAFNLARPDDIDMLTRYAERGGRVILGWCALGVTSDRTLVERGELEYMDCALTHRLCADVGARCDTTYNGQPVSVNPTVSTDNAEVILSSDNGLPLLLRMKCGNGELMFVNALSYPAFGGAKAVFDRAIAIANDADNACERHFVRCGKDVEFALYRQPNADTHAYITAADWYNSPDAPRRCELVIDGKTYPLELPFGKIVKVVFSGSRAAWCIGDAVVNGFDINGRPLISAAGDYELFTVGG